VESRDCQIMLEVEAMRIPAVRSGVQVKLVTTEPARFLEQPAHQGIGVSASPERGERYEVVYVQIKPQGKIVSDPKAGHRYGVRYTVIERSHQPVTLRPLKLVDLANECLQRRKVRPELY
jgi:hypothetical protein